MPELAASVQGELGQGVLGNGAGGLGGVVPGWCLAGGLGWGGQYSNKQDLFSQATRARARKLFFCYCMPLLLYVFFTFDRAAW